MAGVKDMNVVPIRATGGTTVLENTPLPAVAVHVSGHDGRGNTFFRRRHPVVFRRGAVLHAADYELHVFRETAATKLRCSICPKR